ncbi:MAG: ABC transporter ATP-binding protein [Eubacteriales bacterium]|nr:ABC transporter ATP-binding protein [Eubacteriales bacterium]
MSELVATDKLSKKYRGKYALRDADVHVSQGDIYGLIGRNGAGKTTLLKLINSQILPTSGHVMMKGKRLAYGSPNISLGALVESPGFYPDYSALDNVRFLCQAAGRDKKGYAESLLEIVELDGTGSKKAKQFSLGMKQRLGIALALVNEPELLILDEPINGMDPQGIKDIRELLVKLNRQQGVTILISSHILDELAKFATTYGIIKDGLVVSEFSREELESRNTSGIEITAPDIDPVARALREGLKLQDIRVLSPQQLLIGDKVDDHGRVSRFLFDERIYVTGFTVRHNSLEDYFMGLTGGDEK